VTLLAPALANPLVLDLLGLVGLRYWYGQGKPSTPWPPAEGLDCSGAVQVGAVHLGRLDCGEPDRTSYDLPSICDPIPLGSERLGDLVFYGSPAIDHVMLVLAPGLVWGAHGGGSHTHGDDPRAIVNVEALTYLHPVLIGRIREEHRPCIQETP